jgi:hypothetical protein
MANERKVASKAPKASRRRKLKGGKKLPSVKPLVMVQKPTCGTLSQECGWTG